MLTLAFDTATGVATCAVVRDDEVLGERITRAAHVLADADELLRGADLGPTDLDRDPPSCGGAMGIGTSARLTVHLDAAVDGRSIGSVDIAGDRSVADVHWLAYVASTQELGLRGAATIGDENWIRDPSVAWRRATPAEVGDDDLDLTAFRIALSPDSRAAAHGGSRRAPGGGDHAYGLTGGDLSGEGQRMAAHLLDVDAAWPSVCSRQRVCVGVAALALQARKKRSGPRRSASVAQPGAG